MEGNFTFAASGPMVCSHDSDVEPPGSGHATLSESPPPPQIQALSGAPALLLSPFYDSKTVANRLPVELIVNILESGAWEWHELLLLTHICQRWRAIARAIPRLWARAVASAFKSNQDHIRCLPTLLEWSVPYPLGLTICSVPRLGQSAVLEPHFNLLGPHFSRIYYLSVDIACTANVVAVLDAARSGMRSLESLRIKQVLGSVVSVDDRVALDDSDLPLLHTLFFPGFFFTRGVAVKSLKSITVDRDSRSRDIFLAALERCAHSLESLTLERWERIDWMADDPVGSFPSVQLPSLRHLKIMMWSLSEPPVLFLPGLLLPPDVRTAIRWEHVQHRNPQELLPRHLTGLHVPPFFDGMCVHMSGVNSIIVSCFIDGAERLSVDEYSCDTEHVPDLLDEYTSTHVQELALYFSFDNPCKSFINADHLLRFLDGFPNLRRLDLLGKTVRDVQLQLAAAFIEFAAYSRTREPFILGFALQVEEPPADPNLRVPDACYYSPEHQGALVCAQLDALEALLSEYHAAGAPRLHRLELAVTIVRVEPLEMLRAPFYRIADAPPSVYWARELAGHYLPRFQPIVDEVVFFGDTGSAQRMLEGAR